MIRHGVVRATKDLDVVVGSDERTAAGLQELIVLWEATRPAGGDEPRSLPTSGWPLHLRTKHGLIDILGGVAIAARSRRAHIAVR